jgi:hypothetical protein
MKSAEVAKGLLPDKEIHLVDSQGASMAEGILAYLGLEMAKLGVSAEEIARVLNDRASDLRMYVSLETLEYLKKGGRIGGAQAAIGTLLSVKPIIAVEAGVVETADKPRTRAKSRERCIEMICARPIERLAILHTMAPDVDEFRTEVIKRSGIDPAIVSTQIVAPRWGRISGLAASERRAVLALTAPFRQASGGPRKGRYERLRDGTGEVAIRSHRRGGAPSRRLYSRRFHIERARRRDARNALRGVVRETTRHRATGRFVAAGGRPERSSSIP